MPRTPLTHRTSGEGASGLTRSASLADKVAFLRQPAAYPDRPPDVEVVETHMSCVFLAGAHAYKLKKPVRNEYLDFSTLEARWADCVAEVQLNRRLAGDVYSGVVALTVDDDGLALGGSGDPADWLVVMRRLPSDGTLDAALRAGHLSRAAVRRVASRLARFYADAPRRPIDDHEYRRAVIREVLDDRRELLRPVFGLDRELVTGPTGALVAIVQRDEAVLAGRAALVVEGHGDLRPEHIWLSEGEPVIIDCVEFRAAFRMVDPADELAFLGLECERLGAGWVGPELLATYRSLSGDAPSDAVVDLYAARRALLRAKLAIWHLRDADVAAPQVWVDQAVTYLELAAVHADRLGRERSGLRSS